MRARVVLGWGGGAYLNIVHVSGRQVSADVHRLCWDGSVVSCALDCDARTFSYRVDGGPTAVVFTDLPAGRMLFPAVCVSKFVNAARVRILEHYSVPHVGFVVRTRVMCQAGRAHAAARTHGEIVAWLCERAPLWVVVHVCALLREDV